MTLIKGGCLDLCFSCHLTMSRWVERNQRSLMMSGNASVNRSSGDRRFLHRLMVFAVITVVCGAWDHTEGWAQEPQRSEFFAFQNGLGFADVEAEAQWLRKQGYDGVSQVQQDGKDLSKWVEAYEQNGLRVLSVYLNVDDTPIAAEQVQALAHRDALIELTIRNQSPQTVVAVRQTVDMADKLGIRVALYPHHGFALQTISQAVDWVQKVNHPNLGVMFNLCHFLKNENVDDLEATLNKVRPYLFAVSTSGATVGGRQWSELIQPLDEGDFPQERLLKQLKEMQFKGPVSLQCYGLQGDKAKNLERSMEAWKKLGMRVR
jgi:sugar phosphate isomerase/epimerase